MQYSPLNLIFCDKFNRMNKDLTSKRTPLRNSSLANKPFRSPIASLTPKNLVKKASPLINQCSPTEKEKSSTPKRPISCIEKSQIKKRRIETEVSEDNQENESLKGPSKMQLLNLKKRIRSKQQEIESLKVQMAYRRKHNKEDLQGEIKKWREGCQTALIDFQRAWNARNPDGVYYDMSSILKMLNIREEIVKFPDDFDLT